jgi:hypothetical protein
VGPARPSCTSFLTVLKLESLDASLLCESISYGYWLEKWGSPTPEKPGYCGYWGYCCAWCRLLLLSCLGASEWADEEVGTIVESVAVLEGAMDDEGCCV